MSQFINIGCRSEVSIVTLCSKNQFVIYSPKNRRGELDKTLLCDFSENFPQSKIFPKIIKIKEKKFCTFDVCKFLLDDLIKQLRHIDYIITVGEISLELRMIETRLQIIFESKDFATLEKNLEKFRLGIVALYELLTETIEIITNTSLIIVKFINFMNDNISSVILELMNFYGFIKTCCEYQTDITLLNMGCDNDGRFILFDPIQVFTLI